MFYHLFKLICRIILRVFFRDYRVEGIERVPADKPLLIIANHVNALVDPLVIMILLKRRLTLTGKNLLKRDPFLKVLIWGLDIILFHRAQDAGKGVEMRENVKSIARCVEILGAGGAVCIFPEGESHSDPGMRPFKNGAAKIALDYHKKFKDSGDLVILPVGLNYTEKDRFRSGVWVRFGEPALISDWVKQYYGSPQETSRALTMEFDRSIREVTLNLENEKQSILLNWTTEILLAREKGPKQLGDPGASADEIFNLKRTIYNGYKELVSNKKEEVSLLEARITKYHEKLDTFRLDPAEVYMEYPLSRVLYFILRELELILIGTPVALLGIINNAFPYQTVSLIARKLSTDLDHWATNKIYPSMVIYPLFYILQILIVYLLFGWAWAGLYAAVLPYTGYYALLYLERITDSKRRINSFFKLYFDTALHEELIREGDSIVNEIVLLGQYLEGTKRGESIHEIYQVI